MKKLVLLIAALVVSVNTFSQVVADDVIGQFWTEKKEGKIEIYKENDIYFGKIIWRKDARLDTENPDEALRDRSVIGIVFMEDFVFDGGKWVDGEIYSIDNGNVYASKMWFEDDKDTLKLRGFVGLSLFGKTATLTRVKE
ncbi:DUF2147 domain-containing protein [uncultured Croceitalea sp.]|uniref:DUF2147 domain-containing protein n=1 Tax=uncultured Croceitalea sp. TaxID=1798908 RepID=UPI003305AE33